MEKYPTGIYCLIDESCSVSATDDNLLQKIKNTHKECKSFVVPKLSKETFIIIHTAKDVEYNINNFRSKNKGILKYYF